MLIALGSLPKFTKEKAFEPFYNENEMITEMGYWFYKTKKFTPEELEKIFET